MSGQEARRGAQKLSIGAVALVLAIACLGVLGCGGPDQATIDQAFAAQATRAKADLERAVAAATAKGGTALERAVSDQRATDGKAAAEFSALTIQVFSELDGTNFELTNAAMFDRGLPAAASVLRDRIAVIRASLQQITAIQLEGNRFELQRSALVEGVRSCLHLIDSAAADMERGDSGAGPKAASPIIECWAAARDRVVRLGLQ